MGGIMASTDNEAKGSYKASEMHADVEKEIERLRSQAPWGEVITYRACLESHASPDKCELWPGLMARGQTPSQG